MSFLEKVKNMFTEEVEEDEVKVEKVKSHSKKNNRIKKEDLDDDSDNSEIVEDESEKKEAKEVKKPTPVFFSDDDFDDIEAREKKRNEERLRLERERYERELREKEQREKERLEILRREELYQKKFENNEINTNFSKKSEPINIPEYGNAIPKEEKKEQEPKKIFKPTPIISPVYGVLDKNYHKEDIVSRDEIIARRETNVESSIDLVRNKAYGTLEDELENTLFGNNSILFKDEDNDTNQDDKVESINEVSKDDLSALTDDIGKELDELISKKSSNVKKNSEKKTDDIEDDLLEFIDSTLYKKGEE